MTDTDISHEIVQDGRWYLAKVTFKGDISLLGTFLSEEEAEQAIQRFYAGKDRTLPEAAAEPDPEPAAAKKPGRPKKKAKA